MKIFVHNDTGCNSKSICHMLILIELRKHNATVKDATQFVSKLQTNGYVEFNAIRIDR